MIMTVPLSPKYLGSIKALKINQVMSCSSTPT